MHTKAISCNVCAAAGTHPGDVSAQPRLSPEEKGELP